MTQERNYSFSQVIGLIGGFILFVILIILSSYTSNKIPLYMASVAVLMAVWWMTEALPLGATSLLPLILFPLCGISGITDTASQYFNSTIFLFLGGFLIAIAMETWDLHKRIALNIILILGTGYSGIILGFMISTAFLSMFISNTATALMMLPIGLSVISKIRDINNKSDNEKFSISLMLGIAYSASIGGLATLIGTPPNLVYIRILRITFPESPEISFGWWMIFALPIAIIMLVIAWLLLTKILYKIKMKKPIDKSIILGEYKNLGKAGYEEKIVFIVFIITALLWIFRIDMDLGTFTIPGWSNLFENSKFIDDATIAIFMSLILFIIPSKKDKKQRLLSSKSFSKIPWEIVLLFGGGFALAQGFQISGLSELLGNQFSLFSNVSPLIMIFLVCFGMAVLTEFTSNTAITQTMLPILAVISVSMRINPIFLMIPATLSASLAFMLPVSTPPNAIVFSSGHVTIKQMLRTGILLDLIGICFISLLLYFFGDLLWGINPNEIPVWAIPK